MIYLDNAATTFPKPRSVLQAVARAMMFYGANPGRSAHRASLRAAQEVWLCREALAGLLGAPDPARMIFCLNCTDALNMAIQGSLRPGMHVITTALEHNSVLRQLAPLNSAGIIRFTILQPDESGIVTAQQFAEAMAGSDTSKEQYGQNAQAAMTSPQFALPINLLQPLSEVRASLPDTLVICTHASNVTGAIQPVCEIGALCRARGARFILDAAQTAGIIPLDLAHTGCDLAALPGHKGLYGPMGTGVLYIADGANIEPLRKGGTGSSSQSIYQPGDLPECMESGTLNLPGIAGLRAGVDFVRKNGGELREREQALSLRLLRGLAQIPGVRMLGPKQAGCRVGVISFNIGDIPSTEVADALDSGDMHIAVRAGLHCAPLVHEHCGTLRQGAVRISLGAFNTESDVDAALDALEKLAVCKML